MIIGITGGSGAGKTTLLNALKQHGAAIIDCDEVYHHLLRSNAELFAELNAAFPGTVSNGEIDRKALGAIVFMDSKKLLRLNEITHRYVDTEISKLINAAVEPHIAIDAIALVELGFALRCDHVIAVCAPVEARIQRLIKREGISEEYALKRINAQKNDEWFESHADIVLYNNGTEYEFTLKCNDLLDGLLN
jgi:dephospho-CoA kinase